MDALDPHPPRDTGTHVHDHLALAHDRVEQLADLVALRQVGIEIVLAVEGRPEVDLRLQAQPRAHRLRDATLVDHRQHPRHPGIDEGHIGIRLGTKGRGRPGKELRRRGDLRMHLKPDHELPVPGRARDHLRLRRLMGQLRHPPLPPAGITHPLSRPSVPPFQEASPTRPKCLRSAEIRRYHGAATGALPPRKPPPARPTRRGRRAAVTPAAGIAA